MARKLGRLLVSVFGSVLVAVVFNASPGVPPYGRCISRSAPSRAIGGWRKLGGRVEQLTTAELAGGPGHEDSAIQMPRHRKPSRRLCSMHSACR